MLRGNLEHLQNPKPHLLKHLAFTDANGFSSFSHIGFNRCQRTSSSVRRTPNWLDLFLIVRRKRAKTKPAGNLSAKATSKAQYTQMNEPVLIIFHTSTQEFTDLPLWLSYTLIKNSIRQYTHWYTHECTHDCKCASTESHRRVFTCSGSLISLSLAKRPRTAQPSTIQALTPFFCF